MSLGARVAIIFVRGYQLLLGPLLGGACRFEPSCSVYAADAIAMHGALRGGWLAIRRVTSCHPLGRSGYDPVPPRALRR